MRIPPEMKSQASGSGQKLQMGQLISRVQPNYPQEAIDQNIEGTVKAHAAIGPDGAVEGVETNGPPVLAEAAAAAIRQWRYRPTLLNGQAIGADEDIVFVFKLNAPANP
jgi:TonB family protein